MNDIIKIVQALEDSNVLLKGVTKVIKNKTKEPKGGFLSMLLGILGGGTNSKSWFWKLNGFLMPPHPLTNFETQKYYENEPRLNGFFQEIIYLIKSRMGHM